MKLWKALLPVMALALVFTGCTGKKYKNDKLTVCTSFYALYDFAHTVGGDEAEIINMVPTGTEPHDWEPSSHDMLKVQNADVLFYNGLGMESWIDSVKESVGGGDAKYVELSKGLEDKDAADPHVWLSPKNAIEMTEVITEKFCELDPDNAINYRINAGDFKMQLDELDKRYAEELAPYKGKSIVVSHEAYSYLCGSYGIEQVAVEGVIPESEPSPEQMKDIIDYINQNHIKYIFFEELLSPKVVQTISDETGAQLLELNPFEGLSQEDIDAGENYITVMEQNLENIKQALEE